MKIFHYEVKDAQGITSRKVAAGMMSKCAIIDYTGTISIIDTLKATAGLVEAGRYKSGNLRLGISFAQGTYVEELDGSNQISRLGLAIWLVPEQPNEIVVMTPP